MAASDQEPPKTCLYRVLGVDRDATPDAIKNAYKKLVLRWHPDRNRDNVEEAEIQFKQIQTAFEILSNENERAWYDANQERILNGNASSSAGDFQDPCGLNLYQYFSVSSFNGFSNDPNGFFFTFKSAFEAIAEVEEISAPHFGDSDTPWSRVRKFYNFWDNFTTRRKFRWAAKHNLNDAANRRARGMMKKANMKNMDQCRREWEGNVRRLVRFVRNLDPRVRSRAVEEREQQRMDEEDARLYAQEISKLMEARRSRDLQDEVSKLDRTMQHQGGDFEFASKGAQLSCVVCRRKFRSEQTLMTHKSSSKHLQRLRRLQQHLKAEERIILGIPQPDDIEKVMDAATEFDPASQAPPPALPATVTDFVSETIVVPEEDDDASSVAARSTASGFSDFVMVEELESGEDDDGGVDIDVWDGTIAIANYSDEELEIIDVDVFDGVLPSDRRDEEAATEEHVMPPAAVAPGSVDMDFMLAQQLASGLSIAGDDQVDATVLAQLDDSTNLDRLLALQLEQEDLMARRALARASAPGDADAIDSSDDAYDSELDTLVDALNAKMISLDDPNVNVRDLERRLEKAIARSGSSKSRKSKKKRKNRKGKSKVPSSAPGVVDGSSDEAEERVDEFLSSFKKGKEQLKTKKEIRGDKKRRRRRRVANDPNSTSRCQVCHRGFVSKTKLARHIQANPSHVVA